MASTDKKDKVKKNKIVGTKFFYTLLFLIVIAVLVIVSKYVYDLKTDEYKQKIYLKVNHNILKRFEEMQNEKLNISLLISYSLSKNDLIKQALLEKNLEILNIDKLLEEMRTKKEYVDIQGEVIAIMSPHAGHLYAGPVAGYAYAAVRGLVPDIVVVISPMHQPYYQPLITSAHRAYETPLGQIKIDRAFLFALEKRLQAQLGFGLTEVRNDQEHSVEIELPFLQVALENNFKLLPIMVRDQSKRVTHTLGLALADVLTDHKALLVASTDLSHFYAQEIASTLDKVMLSRVEAFDPAGVLKAEEEGKAFACGRGALAATLWAARGLGATHVKVLKYATSGDVTGHYQQVVGYGAAVVTKTV